MNRLREKVITSRINNPCATLLQIGDRCGVTRERVRQILKGEGLPTRGYKAPKMVECLNCGTPTTNSKFCSRKCCTDYNLIKVECSQCGVLFTIPRSDLNGRTKRHKIDEIFCSKKCYGVWFGKRYGRHVVGRGRKWDYEMVWAKHIETGFGYMRLSHLLGIPEVTVTRILRKKRQERA